MARQERSAGFVIFRVSSSGPHEYLLLDYGRHWDFPKGHVEKAEDDLAAAKRELHEETGIADVHIVADFRHEITYYFRDRKKGLIRKTVVFFLSETHASDNDIVLSHEHEAFAFLPFEQAVKRITFSNAREVLRRAEERIGKLHVSSDNLSEGPVSTKRRE